MSLYSESAAGAPSALRLGGCGFAFVTTIIPERDTTGAIREARPQALYMKSETAPLHKHGHGAFCKFRISVAKGLAGVYALVVSGSVRYIGECQDLGQRFNMGYGNISPKNCYRGGQPTNCKINHWVLDLAKSGACVDLYFHPTPLRKTLEKRLIAQYSPPWNR